MEDLAPPVRTVEQSKAGPEAEKVPVDPMTKSLVTRWPVEESTTATSGLGGGERLAGGSAMVLTKTTRSLGVEARAADATPMSRAEGPTVPTE